MTLFLLICLGYVKIGTYYFILIFFLILKEDFV